jgi:hypothetical protein
MRATTMVASPVGHENGLLVDGPHPGYRFNVRIPASG